MARGYVTSETDAAVSILDLDTPQVIARLPAGPVAHAMALTPDGRRLYTVNRGGASLTVVDTEAGRVIGTVPLSSDPMAAAVSPNGRWLAVLGRRKLVAWIIDAITGDILYETQFPPAEPGPPAPAGDGPACTHPVWAADGASFYAEDGYHARLLRIDATDGAVTGVLTLPAAAHMVYPDRQGGRVFALCSGNGAAMVAVVGAALRQPPVVLPVPLAPTETAELHHATFDHTGNRLFIANTGTGRPRGGHSVHVLDTSRLTWVHRLEARAGAGHPRISPDGGRLWVVNHSDPRISVFDIQRLEPAGEIILPGVRSMGHGCFFSADGSRFWAVSNSAGMVFGIDTRRLTVVAQLPAGAQSQDLAREWPDAMA